jgi:hypothetical protein
MSVLWFYFTLIVIYGYLTQLAIVLENVSIINLVFCTLVACC